MVFPSGFSSTIRRTQNYSYSDWDCLIKSRLAWPDVAPGDIKHVFVFLLILCYFEQEEKQTLSQLCRTAPTLLLIALTVFLYTQWKLWRTGHSYTNQNAVCLNMYRISYHNDWVIFNAPCLWYMVHLNTLSGITLPLFVLDNKQRGAPADETSPWLQWVDLIALLW